jgi:hypothetical protein
MRLTNHAGTRIAQRGFNKSLVDIITTHGRVEDAPGGALKFFLGKKEAQSIHREVKRFTQIINRATCGVLIVKDDFIITAYKQR